jgi:hypothetical protein
MREVRVRLNAGLLEFAVETSLERFITFVWLLSTLLGS